MAGVKIDIKTHDYHGHTIYECPWCHFDSEWEATLKQHMNGIHEAEVFALRVQQQPPVESELRPHRQEDPAAAETSEDVQPQIEESE